MKSNKASTTFALDKLQKLLAKDDGRKARIQAMADSIRRKASINPNRVLSGETFESITKEVRT